MIKASIHSKCKNISRFARRVNGEGNTDFAHVAPLRHMLTIYAVYNISLKATIF